MLYRRTYLDKCDTIVRGSKLNTGLNPVSDLLYGRNLSRLLIHFDHNKIKKMFDDKTCPDINKMKHWLRMTNASSIDMSELHKVYGSQVDGAKKRRASSFDLIFFLIPNEWDNGKGFDYTRDYFNIGFYDDMVFPYENYITDDGASWYQPKNGFTWKKVIDFQRSTDDQISFGIKSDIDIIPSTGATVTFTYFSGCNGNYVNKGLALKPTANYQDDSIIMGEPIYYASNGQICHTDADIAKYCQYVKVTARIPENPLQSMRKMTFRLSYEINGHSYKSNPYTLTQYMKGEYVYPVTDDGIYSTATLDSELSRYKAGEESIVIGLEHFDMGCENISLDITDTVNKFITGELENHGIGIAYAPVFEYSDSTNENYTGILTNRTNTFFEPYVETIYEDVVSDDRKNFVLGRKNRLYLYTNIGGDLVNLDQLPTCEVEGTEYEVKQASKGIYYIEITLPYSAYTAPTMLYDKWDGIVYQGEVLSPVELEFTTRPASSFFTIGTQLPEKNAFTPSAYGIKDNEVIKRGDLRKVCITLKKDYDTNTLVQIDRVDVRIYVKDGTAQLDVTPYLPCDRSFNDTYLMLDTSMLIPNTYYMDVRVKYGMEMIEHHEVLKFRIADDENNKYA